MRGGARTPRAPSPGAYLRTSRCYAPARRSPDEYRRIPTVLADLRERLLDARRRGVPFPLAWAEAVRSAASTVDDADERDAWLAALESTSGAWARGYEGQDPPRPERAVRRLQSDPERTLAIPFGACEECGGAIPAPAPHDGKLERKYCSPECRKRRHSLQRVPA